VNDSKISSFNHPSTAAEEVVDESCRERRVGLMSLMDCTFLIFVRDLAIYDLFGLAPDFKHSASGIKCGRFQVLGKAAHGVNGSSVTIGPVTSVSDPKTS
jgi:hypothetical protein